MRTSTTFSILFWIYTSRAKNNESTVYARISVNGKKINISLKCKANIHNWDPSRQRARGTNAKSRALNQYLDNVHAQLVQCYQDLKFKEKFITVELVKSAYLGEDENTRTLLQLINYHSNKTKNTLAPGTIRNFQVTTGYIERFLKDKRRTTDIYLHELNYALITEFESYLHNYWPGGHPKAMSQNTVMKHLQRFRKIVTLGYHLEWMDQDPFRRWKPTFEKRERGFLSAAELSNLETYRLPLERLDRVRDLFVFSCYTGLAYADIMKLTSDQLSIGMDGNTWIITKLQKTKTSVRVPLLQKARELLKKYEGHPITQVMGTLLPVITNEKLNLYLKEVAEAAGIKKNLTFHMARHTFATTVTLSNGVPIETVSKMLGHTRITSTQIYARVLENKISTDMAELQSKLTISRNSAKGSSNSDLEEKGFGEARG